MDDLYTFRADAFSQVALLQDRAWEYGSEMLEQAERSIEALWDTISYVTDVTDNPASVAAYARIGILEDVKAKLERWMERLYQAPWDW